MLYNLVISFRRNASRIDLTHTTRAENVLVLGPNGEERYLSWLGFISLNHARQLADIKSKKVAKQVRIPADRMGYTEGIGTEWEYLEPGTYVRGCQIGAGVYAVATPKMMVCCK